MANKSTTTNKERFPSITELQSQIWALSYSLDKLTKDYHHFYCDLSWSKYGEVEMLKQSISKLRLQLQAISNKMQKGAKN